MSKLINRFWLENEHFLKMNHNKSHILSETPYHDSKFQTRLSRSETFPEGKVLCNKPTPLYTTLYLDLFILYEEVFNMHTGNRNPLQLPEDEQYTKLSTQLNSGKLVHTQNQLIFPALNSS